MTDTPLYTLRDIARDLGIPESTVRYYRDAFATHIATVGRGRRRRYPQEAIEVLRAIKRGYGAGKSREEIEAELSGAHVQQPPKARPRARGATVQSPAEDVLSAILDGERERREALWQMAREIVRLGEVVERQQVVLGEIADRLAVNADRALTAGANGAALSDQPEGAPGVAEEVPEPDPAKPVAATVADVSPPERPDTSDAPDLTEQLDALRAELQRERGLVERLRRSKLEIERRAAAAEARLDDENPEEDRGGSRSLLGRFLGRRATREGGRG